MMHSVNKLVVHCADYDAVSPASVVAYVAAVVTQTVTEGGSKGSQVGAGLEPSSSNKEHHNKGEVDRAERPPQQYQQHQPQRPGRGSREQRRGC